MEIIELNDENIIDINKVNESFEIVGRIKPSYDNGQWTYVEEIFDNTYQRIYPVDECDYSTYIGNFSKVIFLAYSNGKCIGQIILKEDWNKYVFIEDLCVLKSNRGQGVGTALVEKAVEWAKSKALCGLALETQDDNLLACRFYSKCGFVIGGVNTMLYKNLEKPCSDSSAVFWYRNL